MIDKKEFPVTKGTDNIYSAIVTGLAQGENKITFTATDISSSANESEFTVTIMYDKTIIDNVGPVMSLLSPKASGERITEDHITIKIDCKDDNGIASVMAVNGTTDIKVTSSGSTYTAELTKLSYGKNKVPFTATDKSTNSNTSKLEVEVDYNTQIGTVSLASPKDKAPNIELTPTLTWTGGDDPDGDVVYYKVIYGTSATKLETESAEVTKGTVSVSKALTPATTYYWKVSTYSKTNKDKQESEVRSFTTVGSAPGIDDKDLANATIKKGDRLTLSVKVTGTPAPTIQWYHDDKAISGATSATYTKSAIEAADKGSYYVTATNGIKPDAKSKVVTFAVMDPLTIETQPADMTVNAGTPATFRIKVTGSGTITYQWMNSEGEIKGATEATYKINSTSSTDDGNTFYCVVKNETGDVVKSTNAKLTLKYSISYDANGGTGAVPIDTKLYRSGDFATVMDKPAILLRNGYSFYGWSTNSTGNGTDRQPGNNYQVGANNEILYAKWQLDPPVITKEPVSVTSFIKQTASFSITATGSNITYQWQKDGQNVSGKTTASISFTDLAVSDVGVYRCIVSNVGNSGGGKDTSNTAILSVYDISRIKLIPAAGKIFEIGDANAVNASPTHRVKLSNNYYMDSTEVTQGQYESVLRTIYNTFSNGPWIEGEEYSGVTKPAHNINWYDAVLYCNALTRQCGIIDTVYTYSGITGLPGIGCILTDVQINYGKKGFRLPTEAEWEYACRAGTTGQVYWAKTPDDDEYYTNNAYYYLTSVGTLRPNEFRLYDMLGNVAEWCNNWYGSYSDQITPIEDPKGYITGTERILRGGHIWTGTGEFYCADRYKDNPGAIISLYGFRVVLQQ